MKIIETECYLFDESNYSRPYATISRRQAFHQLYYGLEWSAFHLYDYMIKQQWNNTSRLLEDFHYAVEMVGYFLIRGFYMSAIY